MQGNSGSMSLDPLDEIYNWPSTPDIEHDNKMSLGFCRGSSIEGQMSRVEGKKSRVEGKMSRVEGKKSEGRG